MKDEELQLLARELRARDSTIKELADKLTDTAEAAEAAASAAHAMDEERRLACAEIERLTIDAEKQSEAFILKVVLVFSYANLGLVEFLAAACLIYSCILVFSASYKSGPQ